MPKRELTPQQELEKIRGKLKHYDSGPPKVQYWMDTGEPDLHRVLGVEDKGIPYGKMYELFGNNSQGKTVLALDLAAQAQSEGATVAIADFEQSYDPGWARVRGLDTDKVTVFQPYIGRFNNTKKERLSFAEENFEEIEIWMGNQYRKNPKGKIYLMVDSVAALVPKDEAEAGIADQNMRTEMAKSIFLSRLARRWVALVSIYNVMVVWINQVRTKPMAFGNPEYTTGGKSVGFYCSARVELRRVKGGKIMKAGKQIGIKGKISNIKNKVGEGCREFEKCGFKFYADGRSAFISADDLEEV